MIYFLLGIFVGFVAARILARRSLIGKLRHVNDVVDGSIYFYMELNDPNVEKITDKKYVMLEVETQK